MYGVHPPAICCPDLRLKGRQRQYQRMVLVLGKRWIADIAGGTTCSAGMKRPRCKAEEARKRNIHLVYL
jgi:hypothetical protein